MVRKFQAKLPETYLSLDDGDSAIFRVVERVADHPRHVCRGKPAPQFRVSVLPSGRSKIFSVTSVQLFDTLGLVTNELKRQDLQLEGLTLGLRAVGTGTDRYYEVELHGEAE